VIGRKSKKNNIKPKQYKKSKRYGKSKRYNKTQRGGGGGGKGWVQVMDGVRDTLNNLKSIKEQAQSALNAKKKAMNGFITENQSKIDLKTTKEKFIKKLKASKDKIEALMSNLENDNENIQNIVNDGAEFIDSDDVVLNEGQIEGPNEGPNDEQNKEDN